MSKQKPICNRCKHIHDGAARVGERVAIQPDAYSPGWTHATPTPRAVLVERGNITSRVTLDDGTIREVSTHTIKRACGYSAPRPTTRPFAVARPVKPLAEGPWEQLDLVAESDQASAS